MDREIRLIPFLNNAEILLSLKNIKQNLKPNIISSVPQNQRSHDNSTYVYQTESEISFRHLGHILQ